MARSIGKIALGISLLLAVIIGGIAAWIAWFPDMLKPTIERIASAQLGRQVRIDGPLRVGLGRTTSLELRDLHVAAPEWAQADDLASVDGLRVAVDVLAYLRDGIIHVAEFILEDPILALERDAQGRTSWPQGSASDSGSADPMPRLVLDRVAIEGGRVSVADAGRRLDLAADLAARIDPDGTLEATLAGRGSLAQEPIDLTLRVGGTRELVTSASPASVDGSLTVAGTRLRIDGEVREPTTLGAISLSLEVESDDPRRLLALAELPQAGPASPLTASARLNYDSRALAIDDLGVRWGDSDLAGRLHLDLTRPLPSLDGELRAGVLDLASLIPAPPSGVGADAPVGNPLRPLADLAGRLNLRASEIRLPGGPRLHDAEVDLALADGHLRAAPIRIGLPEGTVEGEAETGPLAADQLTLDGSLRASGVGLAGLLGEGYGGRLDGSLDGTLFVGTAQDALARSRLRFEGSGADLAIPAAQLGAFTTTAALEGGRLTVAPFEARLPQGTIRGRIVAGPFDREFAAEVALDAEDVDLAAIARTDGIAGRLQGRLEGTLRGTEPLDLLTRSRLDLDATVSGLRLPQVEERIGSAEIQATLDPDRREAVTFVARATADDRTLNVTGFGGSFRTLAENRGDYPFTIVSELGRNEIEVNGTVSLPLTERRFSATVAAEGPDPSPILALFELPRLQFPPYRLAGALTNAGDELRISGFDGRIGDSDVAADLTIASGGARPRITGTVRSRVLDADDLGGLVGVAPATGPGETASPGQVQEARQDQADPNVLPDERIDPARWRRVDFDLDVRADRIRAGKVPLDGFSGRVTLEDGLLRIADMDLVVGDGHLTGSIEADGRQDPVAANLMLDLQRASVARLLNRLDVDAAAFGTLSGQAQGGVGLGGSGGSIKEILGRADGEVRLLMEGGRVDRTIVAALGLDLLRLLGAATGASPDTVEMRCALANLEVRDGIVATDPLVIDTEIAELGGRGTIDLETEAIDLSLTARPKDTPLLTELTGISVGGRLGQPEIAINPVAVAARGVAAATLGIVLKPFTSLAGAAGNERPSPCARLIEGAPGG